MRMAILLAAAVLLLAASQASSSQVTNPQASSSQGRVGIIDLNRVFEQAPEKVRLEGELAARRTALEEELNRIQAQLTELSAELALLEKGTTRHEEIELKVLTLNQKRAIEQRRSKEEFNRLKLEMHDRLLASIEESVAAYAREAGYTAILQREFTLSREALSWKAVVYHAPEADVTDAVLARLRAE